MQKYNGPAPSVSARAAKLVDSIAADASALRCSVSTGGAGERLIDMGAGVPGGLEAGRRLAEVCMGGLGTVSLHIVVGFEALAPGRHRACFEPGDRLPRQPVRRLVDLRAGERIFRPRLRPCPRPVARRAAVQGSRLRRPLRQGFAWSIEGDKAPPTSVARTIASACGVQPADLTILYAPTGSLAGTVQIAARVLEVALHKAHELHFPLEHIEDGIGTAPIAPPIPDFVRAMGRTNDAIIYGGACSSSYAAPTRPAQKLAQQLPSATCSAYGLPFAEIFAAAGGDFYKIDPMLFSPAEVIVSNLDTGSSFHAGELAPDVVDKSFR